MTGAAGLAAGVSRRPERPDDAAFRTALFGETFGDTFAGLDDVLRDTLLRQQLTSQTAGYRAAYLTGRFDIVELDGAPVGRIVTDLGPEALTLVDIALVTAVRGRGIGSVLLRTMIDEADAASVPVRLRVLASNGAAQHLYGRLGFVEVACSEIDVEMERAARSDGGSAA